jgi:ribonuclease HII
MKDKKILEYAPGHLADLNYIGGIDEVGRGCGAGPVVTACVVLPKGFSSPLIRDSKLLKTEKQKKDAYDLIMENALAVSCKAGSVSDIETLGLNPATYKAMHECINEVKTYLAIENDKLEAILLDGNTWDKNTDVKVELVVKGDDTYTCIAAASIVAKVRRDEYMVKLHELFPNYGWNTNVGYLSAEHIKGLNEHGATKYHRKSYVKKFI